MTSTISAKQLRTGAWYGDHPICLDFPAAWRVTILWPDTPPPLTDDQVAELLEKPVGQPPIRQICRGSLRPLVIVDDLNRPTPVARVMPFLLKHFHEAGISPKNVTVLMAPGTHGAPRKDAMLKKIGPEAASACRLVVHDHTHNCLKMGRTFFGTPVIVDREVASSDFVMGIGGIYPNHTAGLGGGSKLALGVLGTRSIMHLHYCHASIGWGSSEQSNFRKDLDEIARIIRLNTTISLIVNPQREVIRIFSGDHDAYYKQAAAFFKKMYSVPRPRDADVVISNAYPNDLSITFARMKGVAPLNHCSSQVSRIVIASCSEGVGEHGLFPFLNAPWFHRARTIARRMTMMSPGQIGRKVVHRVRWGLQRKLAEFRNLAPNGQERHSVAKKPVWLYRPGNHPERLPSQIPGMKVSSSWSEILQGVHGEQGGKEHLRVVIYPCAALQCLDGLQLAEGESRSLNVGNTENNSTAE